MKSLIAAVFLLILGFSLAESFVLVCYYTNWAQYRPNGARFVPENIDPALCTHLVYASAKVGKEYNLKMTLWNDPIMYNRIMQLKKKNRKLKILLSVDGSFENQGRTSAFSTMISESSKRQTFINSTVNFLNKWSFDGLDINWKFYRNIHGKIPNVDKQSISKLIIGLKKAFDMESKNGGRSLLLTAAVPPQVSVTEKSFDLKIFENSLNWISLKTYDLHGHWERVTGHHTAMESDGAGNPEERKKATLPYVVDYWLKKGFPSNKLVLGLATYGRSFKLLSRRKNGLGALTSFERPVKGKLTGFTGFHAYYEICKNGYNVVVENQALAPYAYSNYDWISYDDALSLKLKIQALVKRKNLFGAMFRSLALDDFSGKFCGEGKHPLVKSVSTELGISAPYPSLKKDATPEEVFFNTRTDELVENMIPLEPTEPTKRFDLTSAPASKNNGKKENDVSDNKKEIESDETTSNTDSNDSSVQKLEVSTEKPSERSTDIVKSTIPPTDIKTSETPITSTKAPINEVEDTKISTSPPTTTQATTTSTTTSSTTTTIATSVQRKFSTKPTNTVITVRPKTTIKNVITETNEVQFPFQKKLMKFDKNTGRLLPDGKENSVQRKQSTKVTKEPLEKSTVATTSTEPTQNTLTTSTIAPTSTIKSSTVELQFPFQNRPMNFDKTTGRLVPNTTENTAQSTTSTEPTQNTLPTSTTIAPTSTIKASTVEVQFPFQTRPMNFDKTTGRLVPDTTEDTAQSTTTSEPTENTLGTSTIALTSTIESSTNEVQSTFTEEISSQSTASTKPTENTFTSSTEASTTTVKATTKDVQSTSTTTETTRPPSTTPPQSSSTTTSTPPSSSTTTTASTKTTENTFSSSTEASTPTTKASTKDVQSTSSTKPRSSTTTTTTTLTTTTTTTAATTIKRSLKTVAPKTTKTIVREVQFPFQKELMKFDENTGRLVFKSKSTIAPKTTIKMAPREVQFPFQKKLMKFDKITGRLIFKSEEKFQSKRSMEPKSKRNILAPRLPVNLKISALETPPPLHERLMRAKKIAEKLAKKGKKNAVIRPREATVSPNIPSLVTEPSQSSSVDSSFSMHHIFSSSIPALNTYTTSQLKNSFGPSSYTATNSMTSVFSENIFKPSSSARTYSKKSEWAEKYSFPSLSQTQGLSSSSSSVLPERRNTITQSMSIIPKEHSISPSSYITDSKVTSSVPIKFPEQISSSVSRPFQQVTPSLNHISTDIMNAEQSSYVRSSEKISVKSSEDHSFKVSSTSSIPNDMMSSFYNKYNEELSYYNQIGSSSVKNKMKIEATPSLSATPSIIEGFNSKLDIESSKGPIVSPTLSTYSMNYAINTRVVELSSVSNDYIESSRYI